MTPTRFAQIVISVLAIAIATPVCSAEKSWHPKLVYRQIGGGYTLAAETARRDKTFFFCAPGKTDCISTKAIGWRKPFIIIRSGDLIQPSYGVVDTSSTAKTKHWMTKSLESHLKTIPIYPAAVAWEKLGPTTSLW